LNCNVTSSSFKVQRRFRNADANIVNTVSVTTAELSIVEAWRRRRRRRNNAFIGSIGANSI
jgi:hypothetical protein